MDINDLVNIGQIGKDWQVCEDLVSVEFAQTFFRKRDEDLYYTKTISRI